MSAGAESASLGDVATLRRWLNETRDRLAVVIDEALGPQEVLGLPDLLTRLEHLLHERGRAHEAALRERDEARANYQWMVDRAFDQRFDGYREELQRRLGAELEHANHWRVRARSAEHERDGLLAECAVLRGALEAAQRELATRGVP